MRSAMRRDTCSPSTREVCGIQFDAHKPQGTRLKQIDFKVQDSRAPGANEFAGSDSDHNVSMNDGLENNIKAVT